MHLPRTFGRPLLQRTKVLKPAPAWTLEYYSERSQTRKVTQPRDSLHSKHPDQGKPTEPEGRLAVSERGQELFLEGQGLTLGV